MSWPFAERRAWFDEHASRPTCPCCGYPTLDQRGAWDICLLCQWEDDGADDPETDEGSSPNHGYTLRRARPNFESNRSLYDPEEAKSRKEDTPSLRAAKEALIAAFDGLPSLADPKAIDAQWKLIRDREGAIFNARHGGAG